MTRMIRTFAVTLLLMGSLVGLSAPVAAEFSLFGDPCANSPDATVCQDSRQEQSQENNSIYGPNGVIATIVNILTLIIGAAAVIMIIVAGMQYMLSNGDAAKISNAKNTIIYALIGIAVAVVARTLVVFIIQRL